MAYARTSAGPAGPARSMHISSSCAEFPFLAMSVLFENRSLVDFQRGHGPLTILRVCFLCGNPRLVAFQIGNEPSLADGDHFPYGNRPMVAFDIGNAPYLAHGDRFVFGNRSGVDFQIGSRAFLRRELIGLILKCASRAFFSREASMKSEKREKKNENEK